MLDGLTQEKYPSGRYVNYTYDIGGRVATVGGSLSASGTPSTPYAGTSTNPITYAAHQGLSHLPLGSGITEIWNYNDRLQATGVQAGTLLTLNFYPCDGGLTICSNNNGNIWREVVTSPSLLTSVTQEYRYDGVNRLAVAVENPSVGVTNTSSCPAVGGSWCEQFGYGNDGFGNRSVPSYSMTINGVTTTTPPANTPTSPSSFDSSNHLTVNQATPDASGNLYQIGGSNGLRYTYL